MRSRVLHVPLFIGVIALCGCQTYQRDLDRAATHYQENRHPEALALLKVLEGDTDSLSTVERARYAYFRGMANFRLEKRREARHWLGRAAANEKLYPNSLSKDEKERADQILAELNEARYGGASPELAPTPAPATDKAATAPGTASAATTSSAPPSTAPTPAAAKPCSLDTECVRGEFCDAGRCRKAAPVPAPK